MKKPKEIVREKLGVEKPHRHTVIWLIVTTIVAILTVAGAVYLLINIVRDIEIVSVKSHENSVLAVDVDNIHKLGENISTLQTDANLLRLVANPNDTVFNVINNALPNEEDATAVAAMIQNNIFGGTGAKVDQVIVTGDKRDNANEIDINFTISGDFSQIISAQKRLENSIRPIVVKSLNITKSTDKYKASFSATTYYLPSVKFAIGEIEVAGQKITIAEPISADISKPNDKIFGEKAINPNTWKQQGVENGPSQ